MDDTAQVQLSGLSMLIEAIFETRAGHQFQQPLDARLVRSLVCIHTILRVHRLLLVDSLMVYEGLGHRGREGLKSGQVYPG